MDIAIFETFVWSWIGLALAVFILLMFITAPYGRHTKTTWGPLVPNRLGWVIMEVFVVVVLYYFILTGENEQSLVNWIIIGLFSIHYLNRSLIFPFRIKTTGKKMPLVIMLMGMFFNLVNGFLIGYYLGNFRVYEVDWLMTPQFIIGAFIFFWGMSVNMHSDNILIGLRKPNETGYKIPRGGMFKYVSAPNLLGEISEWLGFAILTWSMPGLAFFLWSFANLVFRAISHHHWYLDKFEDYPKNRKVFIPRIW